MPKKRLQFQNHWLKRKQINAIDCAQILQFA